jgi:hypothetical protein
MFFNMDECQAEKNRAHFFYKIKPSKVEVINKNCSPNPIFLKGNKFLDKSR